MPPSSERQIEAIKLQQTWSIWLVTVQLAVWAAIAIGDPKPQVAPLSAVALLIGIFFSCISMVAASFLASAHPSMLLRIQAGREDLNIKLWEKKYCPKSLEVAMIEHYAFVVAIVCYGIYLGIRIYHH